MGYNLAYLLGLGLAAIIWYIFFFVRKDLRREQLFVSIISAPLGPISQIFYFSKTYWRPEYFYPMEILGVKIGIEEALFGFITGGIASVVYEGIFRKRTLTGKSRKLLAAFFFAMGASFFVILTRFGINPIWSSSAALLVTAILMVLVDHDLTLDMFFSGLFMLTVSITIYTVLLVFYPDLVEKFWVPEGISGTQIFKIPIEELIWFTSWGAFAGIFYEFWRNVEKYEPTK